MSTATVSSNYLSTEPLSRHAGETDVHRERNGSRFNGSAVQSSRDDDRLLNARQVAAKLGVSDAGFAITLRGAILAFAASSWDR